MSKSDSRPNLARARAIEPNEDEAADAEAPVTDLDALRLRGDEDGALALARAYRNGTAPGGRDLERCLEAYKLAAELGSAEAEYAVALFFMSGGVVAQDFKEATSRLRAAAEKGSIAAKIYLGNLYELGIHYKVDSEKADVWYRSAARSANVDAAPESEEWALELAELGSARHVRALVEANALDETDRARLLQRAKAHGMRGSSPSVPDGGPGVGGAASDSGASSPAAGSARSSARTSATTEAASASGGGNRGRVSTSVREEVAPNGTRPEPGPSRETAAQTPSAPAGGEPRAKLDALDKQLDADRGKGRTKAKAAAARVAQALSAFGYAVLFALAGVGGGYAASLGAVELVANGHVLPLIGTKTHLVFPIVVGVVGLLPACLVYRVGTVLKAVVAAALFFGVGWVAWGTGQASLHAHRAVQAFAFGLAGFLAALLVLGLVGGTKPPSKG